MRFARIAVLAVAACLGVTGAQAQVYPSIPAGTVLGRSGVSSGPPQPIPFSSLPALGGFLLTTSDSQNFGSGTAVGALKICTAGCALPTWITTYGFWNIGNLTSGYPLLSPNQSDTTGPALRVDGDIGAGDYLYFGSSQYAITAISNDGGVVEVTYSGTTNPSLSSGNKIIIGGSQSALNNNSTTPNWTITVVDSTHFTLNSSTYTASCSSNCGYFGTGADGEEIGLMLPGGFPSCRVISPGRRDIGVATDFSGGASILMCPDNNLVGFSAYAAQGEVIVQAYGSGATGNDIIFKNRASASTPKVLAQLGSWGVNNAYGALSFSGNYGSTLVGFTGNSGDNDLYVVSPTGVKFYNNSTQYLHLTSTEAQPTDATMAIGDGTHRFTNAFLSGTLSLSGSSSGTSVVQAPSTGGGTAALFTGSDTIVGRATTDTLTNKTLTSPVISGGTVDNAAIGSTTPSTVKGTTITATIALVVPQYAIAGLPACSAGSNEGTLAEVTNGIASPTYNAAVSTTGSTHDLVYCNGSGWTYH